TIDWNPEDALILSRVVLEGSFTAAARALDLPKSTVSRRVSRLEEELGIELLQRTTRRLSLTDAGRVFHERALTAFEELRAAEHAATSTLDEPQGRLRVTAPVEFDTRAFEAMLSFSARYPAVHLDLDLTNRYVNVIDEGYDAALRGGVEPEGPLMGRSLGPVEIIVVASPGYLKQRGAPRRGRDVVTHETILFPSWVRDSAWHLVGRRGEVRVPVRGRLTVNNLEAVRLAALAGVGLALLPRGHCAGELESGALQQVLPQLGLRGSGLWVVHPRTRHQSAKVRAFVEHLVETVVGET
ncbi:MAG: LysR family transcriptional regulator, partial [Acidobacteriota bacterium]